MSLYRSHAPRPRGLRADAYRFVRPDAARFLKPGVDPVKAFPALATDPRRRAQTAKDDEAFVAALAVERGALDQLRQELLKVKCDLAFRRFMTGLTDLKYSPSQLRVPAGNGRPSGRWSSGSYGNGERPRVVIDTTNLNSETGADGGGEAGDSAAEESSSDTGSGASTSAFDLGDVSSEVGSLGLFNIAPRDNTVDGGVQLAGNPPRQLPPIFVSPEPTEPLQSGDPGIGHNQGPPLGDPPEIPSTRPDESSDRTRVQRSIATWLGQAFGLGVAIDIYMGVVNAVEWLEQYQGAIETYRDPPRTYQELTDAVRYKRAGTEIHHVIERTALEQLGFGRREINAPQNRVRIPTLKHYEITSYYSKPNKDFNGLTPREYLADKSIEERFRVGRKALIDVGVLKP